MQAASSSKMCIRDRYTVEAGRPDCTDAEKLAVIKEYGATRISINPQTFSDEVLANIGRKHSVQDILACCAEARAAGWTEEQIDDFFLKRFDCSPEKYGMARAIADLQEPILKAGSAPKTYSLYIGIPFCPSRCSYCSFVSCNLDRL